VEGAVLAPVVPFAFPLFPFNFCTGGALEEGCFGILTTAAGAETVGTEADDDVFLPRFAGCEGGATACFCLLTAVLGGLVKPNGEKNPNPEFTEFVWLVEIYCGRLPSRGCCAASL
jgi:hypothetical protein